MSEASLAETKRAVHNATRDQQVCALVAAGHDTPYIATCLGISQRRVRAIRRRNGISAPVGKPVAL